MMSTGRTLMALAVKHKLKIRHADCPQAFLNGDLSRPLYVDLHTGTSLKPELLTQFQQIHGNKKHALRLRKSIYGLNQAPLCWSNTLNKWLT